MASPTEPTILRDHGFADLSRGTLGNAGQNLYVSRAGVLQRIAYASLTGSGYVDLPFANSHDDGVSLPAYVYLDPLNSDERLELDTFGAYAGAAGDLTGDGYDDLVIANQYDGATNELYGQVYFGGPDGYRRKRMLQLWAPSSKDVVLGTFAPGDRPSILFVSREWLRRFTQDDRGFASRRFDDLALPGGIESVVAGDLDGDGVDDLVVRAPDGRVRVFWGGPGGLDPDRHSLLPAELTDGPPIETRIDTAAMGAAAAGEGLGATGLFVYRPPTASRLKIIEMGGRTQLFLCPDATTSFIAFDAVREPAVTLRLDSGPVISAAVGDVTGDGRPDLVLATRQVTEGVEQSRFHAGTADGGFATEPIMIATRSANEVVIADLDGDGRGEVIVCQDQLPDSYTHESLIFAGTPDGPAADPRRLLTHCALDVMIIRWPGDGRPKPVFVNHLSNTVRGNVNSVVYLGGPDGYAADRRLEFPGWAATELKFVDFTDSGAPDVYVANSNENWLDVSNGSFVYYRNGDAFPLTDRVELPTEHNMSGVIADLDRNGYLDLITTGWGQDEIVIFRGGPDGFGAPERIKLTLDGRTYDQPRYLSLADLNRDGWLDLIIPELGRHGGVIILWGGPDGFNAERSTVLDCGTAVSSRVADLDGDGWLDLIIGGFKGDDPRDDYRTFVYVYWGGPDGFRNDRRTQLPANFPVDVGVADLDNDGRLDLVVTNYHGHQNRDLDSYIYWGGPDGDFHPHRITRLFHHSACGVLLGDFDEDGYVDLAIANHKTYGNHPGESYVWHNGPDGFSPERRTALPTAGPHGLSHLDFGNVYDRGPEEYFESRVFELTRPGHCTKIDWTGDVPAKTWVTAWLRSAGSPADLAQAPWVPVGPEPSIPVQRFVQYRLALGATNSVATPRLTGVELTVSSPAP